MTFNYKNVYLNETSTVCGPVEKEGPLKNYFDKSYDDMYFGEKSFEKAEADFPLTSVLSIFFTYLTHCTCNY